MMRHSLEQHAKCILTHRSTTTRFFTSNINKTVQAYINKTVQASSLTLQDRIGLALDQKAGIITVIEQWRQQQGYRLNPSLVKGLLVNLCSNQRLPEALEISNWMIENKICNLTPDDFASRFDLTKKVLGLEEAEKFFESIPENQRSRSIYESMLRIYARRWEKDDLAKAETNFKKMRELGFLVNPSPYNSMISVYDCMGNRYMVDEILREMKESNIEFDSCTVNKALRVYANVSDVTTMEKFLADWGEISKLECHTLVDMAKAYVRDGSKEKAKDMLRLVESLRDPESYGELMRLYGEAGEREDVYRVWDRYKISGKLENEGFRALIGSLLNLDDIKGAEEMYYKEWERSGLEFDVRIPTMLVSSYKEKGMTEKADKLMNKTMRNKGIVSSPMSSLLEEWEKKGDEVKPVYVRNYIKDLCDLNHFSKALEASSWMSEKKLFDMYAQDYATRLKLIEKVLGLEEAEKFFESSIPKNMKDYSVYSTLLTLYTRYGKTTKKAEATFEKMRELGFLSKLPPFNSLISLYTVQGEESKVMKLLEEMKENNIELDNVTMNNVLRVNASNLSITSMDKYKSEWDGDAKFKLEVTTKYAMAEAYERHGLILKAIEVSTGEKEVDRLWNEYKQMIKRNGTNSSLWNEGYRSVISSLLKLEEVERAQEMYNEWASEQGALFDARIPGLLMSRYCELDDKKKVKKMMDSSRTKLMETQVKLLFTRDRMMVCAACVIPPSLVWYISTLY